MNTYNWNGDETQTFRGTVKWFNTKKGYGFITMTINDVQYDVFVHHTSIKLHDNKQFKTLYQGEYVDFHLSTADDHPYQAVAVTGVDGGRLMCEMRQQRRRPQKRNVRPKNSRDNKGGSQRSTRIPVGNGWINVRYERR